MIGIGGFALLSMPWNLGQSFLSMLELSEIASSTAQVYHVHDALSKICETITGVPDCFRSNFFGKYDSQPYSYLTDGPGAYLALTNGLNIRQMKDKEGKLFPVTVSFKSLFDDLDAIFCLGMRIESHQGREYIRVEHRSYFYQAEQAPDIPAFSFVPNVERTANLTHIYNEIEAGYAKWQAESINGMDEFNSKRNYSAPNATIKKRLSIVCNAITGGYLIETTRRQQFKQNATKDFSTDNDLFLIAANRVYLDGRSPGTMAERNEAYQNIDNLLSPETAYNIRLSPLRMMCNWWPYLSISLHKNPVNHFSFASGTGNYQMKSESIEQSTTDIGLITENMNLSAGSIAESHREPLFAPESFEYSVPLTFEQFLKLKSQAIYTFAHSCTDQNHIAAFIKEVSFRSDSEGWLANLKMVRK
jgi:hypothetical protein